VELRGRHRVVATVPTAGAGPRRYWALAGPAGLADAEIAWRDGDGRIGGRLDVGHRFGRPERRREVLRGAAPGGRRWTLTAYEGRRKRIGNDVYEPEGLPCLLVEIDPPPARSAAVGGFCGVQPATPGFTRAQRRIGGPRRLLLLYGHAPAAARHVQIEGTEGERSTAARRALDGSPGRFWGVALPYAAARGATVRWVGSGGRRGRRVQVLPW